MSAPPTWEYCIVSNMGAADLIRLGELGWELVLRRPAPEAFYFKRPKASRHPVASDGEGESEAKPTEPQSEKGEG